jgi:hypothetical protein
MGARSDGLKGVSLLEGESDKIDEVSMVASNNIKNKEIEIEERIRPRRNFYA